MYTQRLIRLQTTPRTQEAAYCDPGLISEVVRRALPQSVFDFVVDMYSCVCFADRPPSVNAVKLPPVRRIVHRPEIVHVHDIAYTTYNVMLFLHF